MHIAEGMLPLGQAAAWTLAAAGPVVVGARRIMRTMARAPRTRLCYAAAAAFLFLLSALKLPSVAGSSSHPSGAALGTLLVGPVPMALLGVLVLVFQALLLAHGGLTTLGANTIALAVAGPWVTWLLVRLLQRLGLPEGWRVGLAAGGGALATYAVTALQLAMAAPASAGGVGAAFASLAVLFGITQVPLAIAEGMATVWAYRLLREAAAPELALLVPPASAAPVSTAAPAHA